MKTETGITKSWPYRKSFRSGTLVMSFGCSKEFYKNTFPFSSPPPKNTSVIGTTLLLLIRNKY